MHWHIEPEDLLLPGWYIYRALPMGAVQIGHNSIIDLKDVPCEEVDKGETKAGNRLFNLFPAFV